MTRKDWWKWIELEEDEIKRSLVRIQYVSKRCSSRAGLVGCRS